MPIAFRRQLFLAGLAWWSESWAFWQRHVLAFSLMGATAALASWIMYVASVRYALPRLPVGCREALEAGSFVLGMHLMMPAALQMAESGRFRWLAAARAFTDLRAIAATLLAFLPAAALASLMGAAATEASLIGQPRVAQALNLATSATLMLAVAAAIAVPVARAADRAASLPATLALAWQCAAANFCALLTFGVPKFVAPIAVAMLCAAALGTSGTISDLAITATAILSGDGLGMDEASAWWALSRGAALSAVAITTSMAAAAWVAGARRSLGWPALVAPADGVWVVGPASRIELRSGSAVSAASAASVALAEAGARAR